MRGEGKQATSRLIKSEERRLSEVQKLDALRKNNWVRWVTGKGKGIPLEPVADAIREAAGFEDFVNRIRLIPGLSDWTDGLLQDLRSSELARGDLNKAREILEHLPFEVPSDWLNGANTEQEEILPVEVTSPAGSDVPARSRVKLRRRASKKAAKKKASKTPSLTSGS